MSLAPVVMFVYNRADHFTQTFEALNRCPEAAQSDLYIFSDGAKRETDAEKVREVRAAVEQGKKTARFQSITVYESPVNRGLAASVIAGVTEVIEKYGKVIVLEDDCVPSPYFLKYMNQCLEYYRDNERAGAVAGFAPQLPYPESFTDDVFFAYRSCSCAWATWKECWDGVDWDLAEIGDFYRNPELIRKLNANGNDRFIRLYRQTRGNGSSWSVRFGAHLVRHDRFTVYPRYSYIQNIGCDASGVHSKAEDAASMSVDLSKAIENVRLCPVTVLPEIQKIMKKHYSCGVLSDLKRWAAVKAIVLKERRKG